MRTDILLFLIFEFRFSIEGVFHCSRITSDVSGLQETGDNHDALGPCFDQFRQIVQLDAADTENRNANGLVDPDDIIQADGRIVGLCRSRENWAEADVIGAFIKSTDRLVDAVG